MGCGDRLAAGVWGAVFLESFLEEALMTLGLSASDRDLGGMINRLRQEKSLPNIHEVLNQCEMVRAARNGLVHAGDSPGRVVETYSATITGTIPHILRLARPWFPTPPSRTEPTAAFPKVKARVFLSTITPHLKLQSLFLMNLEDELRARGLEPVRAELKDWDRKDPVGKVISFLRGCDACLCVGLERSHAYLLCEREGGEKATETTHGFYTSGWLNLETGAAFALGMPVLVLCEARIVSDGVFDRNWNSSQPFVIESRPPTIEDPAVPECLARLEDLLAARATEPSAAARRPQPSAAPAS